MCVYLICEVVQPWETTADDSGRHGCPLPGRVAFSKCRVTIVVIKGPAAIISLIVIYGFCMAAFGYLQHWQDDFVVN